MSNGASRIHRGNFGVYGLINQMLWRASPEDPTKGIGGFARIAASLSDRNLMSYYAEAGLSFMGIWRKRPYDTFGFGLAYSRLSSYITALDTDPAYYASEPLPIRTAELVTEITYQAQMDPSWIIQPDFQYIFRPGGGVLNPLNPVTERIPDAAVFGIRTCISF